MTIYHIIKKIFFFSYIHVITIEGDIIFLLLKFFEYIFIYNILMI